MVLFGGDIHGQWQHIVSSIKKYKISDSAIFIAGDIGIGFDYWQKYKKTILYYSDIFHRKNIRIYCIRGNHDDPHFFSGNYDTFNIKFLPDYSIIEEENIRVLCIGGGVSIDRIERNGYLSHIGRISNNKIYHDWWYDENAQYDSDAIEKITGRIDAVVTHVSPNKSHVDSSLSSVVEMYAKRDELLVSDLLKEEETMKKIRSHILKKNLGIKCWFIGHYHHYKKVYEDGINYIYLDIENDFMNKKYKFENIDLYKK